MKFTNVPQFQLFISCPGDVDEERVRITEICRNLETTFREMRQPISLIPLYWKDIVGEYGDMRPQTLINRVFSDYGFYVGLLWKRFGTPTEMEDGQTFDSGTEEEFYLATERKEAGEDITIYFFFKAPGDPPVGAYELEQYNKVLAFKKKIQPNGWVNYFENAVQLTDKLTSRLTSGIHNKIREEKIEAKSEIVDKAGTRPDMPTLEALAEFVAETREVPPVEAPIARTVTLEGEDPFLHFFSLGSCQQTLAALTDTHKHLALLGNAGSGKSTELVRLVEHFQHKGTALIPVFKKLSQYRGGSIEDFLQPEIKEIPAGLAVIVLDALDEIEPPYFKEAVASLDAFSEKYPETNIIVSSRTNFYELPAGKESGTLKGFDICYIDEVSFEQIIDSVDRLGGNGQAFLDEAVGQGYRELVTKPFFLNILAPVYLRNQNLKGGRHLIFEEAIRARLQYSRQDTQDKLMRLLTRMALVMEYIGRNYLTEAEFTQTIYEPEDRDLVSRSAVIVTHKGNWSFEHNNIQEYFAAKGMIDMNFDQVKNLITFPPAHNKIKPGWMNTLSFYVAITEGAQRDELIAWIVATEPEAVIKFEPHRVADETRLAIFKGIFESFRQKQLWIRSNKFSEADLAYFAEQPAALDYLAGILDSPYETFKTKLNALSVLEHFAIPAAEKGKIRQLVLNLINANWAKPEIVYSAVNSMAKLQLFDDQTIAELTARLRQESLPYFRATVYSLLTKTNKVHEYLDVFLEGIAIEALRGRNNRNNRDNLLDETILLKRGLTAVTDQRSVYALFEFFKEPYNTEYGHYRDKMDVLKNAIGQAIRLFPEDPEVFTLILSVYNNYGRSGGTGFVNELRKFFEQTGTVRTAFEAVFHNGQLRDTDRDLLLSFLLNEDTVAYSIRLVLEGAKTEKWLVSFYIAASNYTRQSDLEDKPGFLRALYLERTGQDLEGQRNNAIQELRRSREQESFDLLFDPESLKEQVRRIMRDIGEEEVGWNEIWSLYTRFELDEEQDYPKSAVDIVLELTRHGRSTNIQELEAYMANDTQLEFDRFESIYNQLKNYNQVQLSAPQTAMINEWVNRWTQRRDFIKAISRLQHGGYIDNIVLMINYFIKNWGIRIPDDKMLDLTEFYDFSSPNNEDPFAYIVNQVGEKAVAERVVLNLRQGDQHDKVWENNAEYAISLHLEDAYEPILNSLVAREDVLSVKAGVARRYLEETGDATGLMKVLYNQGKNSFRWDLADILKDDEVQGDLKDYLMAVLHDDSEEEQERLQAAKRLTAMNIRAGFDFYADYILSRPQLEDRYDFWFRFLNNLTSIELLPKLMALLEYSLQPQNTADVFNRIDGQVTDALFNLAIYSAGNLQAVKQALEAGIAAHNPDWNFLFYLIERMEFQFNLNQSQAITLDNAIAAIDALGL
ncbi:hypothetical protein [Mucilaginibacter pedocola]|uniref:DUF4062 domain-containing protein n=1 Tax=Mucilaginibacter pedocola TaxID=1792845 RepID=A0A1S9PFU7_9SPHI|nr:hypothetical protein [Mucilaginibacter pedocola]OOQ59823.1 hypothetical protein BC343_06670 [Mucilaginibacter pedocola]